jgi:hypothetical protein
VRLIRIRTLPDAGVPLARVQEPSTPDPRSSPTVSRRSTRTCAPRSGGCRTAKKHEQLDHPDMVKLYSFFRGALDGPPTIHGSSRSPTSWNA